VTDEVKLPESTVHRVLARRGLMKKQPDDPTSKDRRRFEHECAGDLWMSDVMYGPKIRDARHQRQTHLIAFIDDPTRVVPYAAFTFSAGAVTYLSVLEQAVRRRGDARRSRACRDPVETLAADPTDDPEDRRVSGNSTQNFRNAHEEEERHRLPG
jgi:hypothetical protein